MSPQCKALLKELNKIEYVKYLKEHPVYMEKLAGEREGGAPAPTLANSGNRGRGAREGVGGRCQRKSPWLCFLSPGPESS